MLRLHTVITTVFPKKAAVRLHALSWPLPSRVSLEACDAGCRHPGRAGPSLGHVSCNRSRDVRLSRVRYDKVGLAGTPAYVHMMTAHHAETGVANNAAYQTISVQQQPRLADRRGHGCFLRGLPSHRRAAQYETSRHGWRPAANIAASRTALMADGHDPTVPRPEENEKLRY